MTGDRSLVIEAIATNHIHRALEDEPDRCVTLAHVEDDLTRCEFPRWSTRKAFRRVDLPRIEHGKQLVTTGFDEGHRGSLGGTPPFTIARKVCSPPLRAGMVADHYTNPDNSDVRVEAEQDAGDLYSGEDNRRHNRKC